MKRSMLLFFGLSVAMLALAQQPPTVMKSDAPLQNTRWKLVQLPGSDTLPQLDKDAWIQFELNSNRFRGNAGCNNMTGTYQATDQLGLKIGPAALTRMACRESMMKVEQGLTWAVTEANSYRITGDQLTLLKDGQLLATFEALYLR